MVQWACNKALRAQNATTPLCGTTPVRVFQIRGPKWTPHYGLLIIRTPPIMAVGI